MQSPLESKCGASTEFFAWCKAGPGELVYHHKTEPTKLPYTPVATSEIAVEYMEKHLTKRYKLNNKLEVIEPRVLVERPTLGQHTKMLSALFNLQQASGELPDGAKAPNHANLITAIKKCTRSPRLVGG